MTLLSTTLGIDGPLRFKNYSSALHEVKVSSAIAETL
jgi:hypothetical protein